MATYYQIQNEPKMNFSAQFYYLSSFWRRWKKSVFFLDLEFNILKFRKKKKNFVAQLHEFNIEYLNDYKKHHCLQLISKGKKRKKIYIGTKDKKAILEWYTRIKFRVFFRNLFSHCFHLQIPSILRSYHQKESQMTRIETHR